jgi:ABC-type transport system involved in cytochrome c biogenesis permease subunit
MNSGSLVKRAATGAGIGLLLIGVFLFGVHDPNPEWGRYWMIRPMVIVPLAGATGGAFFHLMLERFRGSGRIFAIIVSCIVFIIGLWMGFVLGLDGTLWD